MAVIAFYTQKHREKNIKKTKEGYKGCRNVRNYDSKIIIIKYKTNKKEIK